MRPCLYVWVSFPAQVFHCQVGLQGRTASCPCLNAAAPAPGQLDATCTLLLGEPMCDQSCIYRWCYMHIEAVPALLGHCRGGGGECSAALSVLSCCLQLQSKCSLKAATHLLANQCLEVGIEQHVCCSCCSSSTSSRRLPRRLLLSYGRLPPSCLSACLLRGTSWLKREQPCWSGWSLKGCSVTLQDNSTSAWGRGLVREGGVKQ